MLAGQLGVADAVQLRAAGALLALEGRQVVEAAAPGAGERVCVVYGWFS